MKKLSWKLLLVVALIAVLIGCMVACNKTPNEPADPPVYDEPSDSGNPQNVFFTELYNVARGIGNEKIEEGKNVYVEADLGLELGTKGTTTNSFKLGIALKAVIDRENDGKDTALSLDLTSGTKTILGVCYTATDKMAYVTLGDQKVKINTALVDLGSLIGGLFDINVKEGLTVGDLIGNITKDMKGAWSLDDLVKYILTEFNLKESVAGLLNGIAGEDVGDQFLDRDGNLDLKKTLTSPIILAMFSASNNTANGTYTATATSALTDILKGALKAGTNDGLGLKLSFGAKDHKLTDGVKVELELSPEGTTEKSFAAISINHLRIKEAGKQAEYAVTAPTGEYKENLQLQIDERISFAGFGIISNNYKPDENMKDLHVGLYADLDLVHETQNTTEIRLFINFDSIKYATEKNDLTAIDLTYKQGNLSFVVNNNAFLIDGSAVGLALGANYGMVLAGPIGNLIEGILNDTPYKAEFDATYWKKAPTYNTETKSWEGGEYNEEFKGMRVKNLGVDKILALLKSDDQLAATSEDPQGTTPAESTGINIYKTVADVLSLIGSDNKGNLAVKCESLFNFIAPFFNLTKSGLTATITKLLNDLLSFYAMSVNNMFMVNGLGFGAAQQLPEFLDAPLTANFNLDNGFNWDIHITKIAEEYNEDGSLKNVGAHIDWTSSIKFSENKVAIVDPYDALVTASEDATSKLPAARAAQATAQSEYDAAVTAETTAKSAYEGSDLYKAYTDKTKEQKAAKKEYDDEVAKLKAIDTKIYGSPYTKGDLGQIIRAYEQAYTPWAKGKDGDNATALEKAKNDALKAVTDKLEALTDKKAEFTAAWETVKTKIEAYGDKLAEEAAALATAQADVKYTTYTTATQTKNAKNQTLTAANKTVADLEVLTRGFFEFDLNAPTPQPEPQE